MSQFVPTTEALLKKARSDRDFRQQMVTEHLNHLMTAMGRARQRAATDPAVSSDLQEGARLAAKLTEMLDAMGATGSSKARA
jgi:hypothetical protein